MKKYAKFELGSVRFSAFVWLAVLLLLAANPHLSAQTAHAGATIPVGSGFSQSSDVAVDGNGNVFVSDTDHDAVKEIVAVNGAVSSSSQVETVGRNTTGIGLPFGIALDGSGDVIVSTINGTPAVASCWRSWQTNGVVSSQSAVQTFASGFVEPVGRGGGPEWQCVCRR
jgi:hypothetical protein